MFDRVVNLKIKFKVWNIISYRKVKYTLVVGGTILKESINLFRLMKKIEKKSMYATKDEYNSIINNIEIRENRFADVLNKDVNNFEDFVAKHKEIVELKFELYVRYIIYGYDKCTAMRKIDSMLLK